MSCYIELWSVIYILANQKNFPCGILRCFLRDTAEKLQDRFQTDRTAHAQNNVDVSLITGTIAIMGVDQRKTQFLGLFSGIWPSRDPQIASAHA